MNLDAIQDERRARIKEVLEDGDGYSLSAFAYPNGALQFVTDNSECLMRHGLYEQSLFMAYKICTPIREPHSSTTEAARKIQKETNPFLFYANKSYPQSMIRELFETADSDRLLAAGDPLPRDEPFTIYRGTPSASCTKSVRGLSWSGERAVAEAFSKPICVESAARFNDPGVFTTIVFRKHLYCYSKFEMEFVVKMSPDLEITRIE
jgi:hypothetical protein